MKAIQDFAATQNTALGRIETAVATIAANSGGLSADDQSTLDAVQSRTAAVVSSLEALANPPAPTPPTQT